MGQSAAVDSEASKHLSLIQQLSKEGELIASFDFLMYDV